MEIPIQYIPTNLNPALSNDTNSQFILNNIADGLVGWSYSEGIYPEIAESWKEVSEGNIIFNIRKDLLDFDGKKLGCKNVLDIFNDSLSTPGPFQSTYKKITKLNCIDSSLNIKSMMSSKDLLAFLASPQGKIIKFKNNIIKTGIGAFSIEVKNKEIRLFKNKNYYLKSKIFLEEILLKLIPDNEALALFKNKKIDLILLSNLSFSKKDKKSYEDLKSINLLSTWGVAFNQQIKPYNDREFRQCLIYNSSSIDWVEKFYPNNLPAFGPIPFGQIGYTNSLVKLYSGKMFPYKKIEVYIPAELENNKEISNWLTLNFDKCLSAGQVIVHSIPFDEMMKLFNEDKMGAFLMSFNKETISDGLFYKSFYSQGKENFYKNYSKSTEESILRLENSNSKTSIDIGNDIASKLAGDGIMVPLMHPVHQVLVRKCISNLILNPINEGYFIIKNIRNSCL
jgi:ABC-type transport system substrate-binding protein